MGSSVSRNEDFTQNELLKRFVGRWVEMLMLVSLVFYKNSWISSQPVHVDASDFWDDLLKYTMAMPANSEEQLALDSRLETLCQQFLTHNLQSGNLGSLIEVFLGKVTELLALSDQQNNVHVWQTFNAMFIIRTLVKYMIETGSEFQLLQQFEIVARPKDAGPPNGNNNPPTTTVGSKFEAFVEAVINLVVVIPVKWVWKTKFIIIKCNTNSPILSSNRDNTYHLHLEAVNNLITLLSIRLYSTQPTTKSVIYR